MPELPIGKDVSTAEDSFEVTPTAAVPVPVGTHTFQLIVVDGEGNRSEPQLAKVFVFETDRPTARLTAIPERVAFGQPFRLSGKGSNDVGSGIKTFIWTRID
jgi:hypothetical protein